MQTRIQKWGNSLGLRIPKPVADQAHIAEGTLVTLRLEGAQVVIEPTAPKEYTLADLLSRVTEDNLHDEVPTGPRVGREAW